MGTSSQKERWYLHNTVCPTLANPISCPHIVSIFCKSLHQSVLIRCQLYMVEVQRGWLKSVTLHVTSKQCFVNTISPLPFSIYIWTGMMYETNINFYDKGDIT